MTDGSTLTQDLAFLEGGGEMGALIRAHDWSASPLGPPTTWPQSLRSVAGLLLSSRFPMFVAWGEHLGFLYNDPYAEILGAKHPAALGKRFRDVWEEIWPDIAPLIDAALTGEASYREDLLLVMARKGFDEQTWFTFSYSPVRDESGQVAGMHCACTETTARVLAEREKAAERERLARMFGQAPGFMALLDGPGHVFKFVNAAYLQLVGHRDVIGKPVREALLEVEGQGFFELLDKVYATGELFVGRELSVSLQRTPDAPTEERIVDFVYQPIIGTEGGVGGIFIEGSDVTDRSRKDTDLRESEARYRTLFEAIDAGFCVVEVMFDEVERATDYRFVEANPAFERQTGLHDAVGRTARELVPDLEPFWFEVYGRVALTGEAVRFENSSEPMGRWFDVHALRVGDPQARRVAILFNDISARRNAKERLRELNETLEARVARALAEQALAEEALRQSQKMEAVGQLTGGLAHDFNNLLAGVSGSLELMGTRIAQGRIAEVERYLIAAQGAAKRATALTHRLLAFSRRQTLDPKPTSVNALVTGMEELIRRTVGPQVAVECVTGAGVWSVLVDPNQLENALLNLCLNARDAMPEGGKLTIETANRWLDERAARARDLPPGQYVSLCVSDDGVGMSADEAAKAFDPFFTTKPIGLGTGLGLSMVYGFARQSGGQARIYSEPGRGSMVCLYLPRHLGEEGAETLPEGAGSVPGGSGETVLVIDDEPLVRMLVVDVLEELGYGVIEADDGPGGLKVLRSDARVDLLITDVGLPGGMNGRQVADAARALRPDLKIMFVTGYAENAVLNHGHLDHGMSVVTKPFGVEELGRRIKTIISGG